MPARRPPVDVKALGERLRALRGDRAMEEVVASIQERQGESLTRQSVSLLERGAINNPGSKTLDMLAREYGVTVEFLLYGTKERTASAK